MDVPKVCKKCGSKNLVALTTLYISMSMAHFEQVVEARESMLKLNLKDNPWDKTFIMCVDCNDVYRFGDHKEALNETDKR